MQTTLWHREEEPLNHHETGQSDYRRIPQDTTEYRRIPWYGRFQWNLPYYYME